MKKQFGAFSTESTDYTFTLDYSRTTKDWFDILVAGVPGVICFLILFFFTIRGLGPRSVWFFLLVILVVGCAAVFLCSYAYSRLLEPTKGIIHLDKPNGTLSVKTPKSKTLKFVIADLRLIHYHYHSDIIEYPVDISKRKKRFWGEVELEMKGRKKIKIQAINLTYIIDRGPEAAKKEIEKTTKDLAKNLGRGLGVESRLKRDLQRT